MIIVPGHRHLIVLALLLLVNISTGCKLIEQKPEPVVEEVTPLRKERKQDIISSFENRRNQAQFDAALSRWEHGDSPGSATLLEELLMRQPDHREARQSLADLYVEQENYAAAHQQLTTLLKQAPDDPQAVHSMALLLESTSRCEEAVAYYRRAVELAPDNELYRLTYQAAAATHEE